MALARTLGIPAETPRAVLEKPLSLTLCSSSPPRRSVCDSICDEIRGLGGEAVGVPGDLTKPGVIQELVDAAIREFSGIDILVNNA